MNGTGAKMGWYASEEREWIVEDPSLDESCNSFHSHRYTIWRRALVALCLLSVLSGVVHALWSRAERNLNQAKESVAQAYALEETMPVYTDFKLLDPLTSRSWQRSIQGQIGAKRIQDHRREVSREAIEATEIDGDMALVHLVIAEGPVWLGSSYREIRFYRATQDGWLRSAPDRRFWGEERSIETQFFNLEYHERDSEAVLSAAAAIDTVYRQLRQQVGLDPPIVEERFTIRISPNIASGMDWTSFQFHANELRVPSPVVVPRSRAISDVQVLRQLIDSILFRHVMSERLNQLTIACHWQPLADGLQLHALQRMSTLPSRSQYELEQVFQERVAVEPPLGLADLQATDCWWYRRQLEQGPSSEAWLLIAANSALANHIQASYGNEKVSELIAALERFDTWEELIPALFNVEAAGFEQSWQKSLQ